MFAQPEYFHHVFVFLAACELPLNIFRIRHFMAAGLVVGVWPVRLVTIVLVLQVFLNTAHYCLFCEFLHCNGSRVSVEVVVKFGVVRRHSIAL